MTAGVYYRLEPAGVSENVADLRGAALAAVKSRERMLTIALDTVPRLDNAILNELICALRRLRDGGGTVRLHVTRPDLLLALETLGLDRVFVIVSVAETGPSPTQGHHPLHFCTRPYHARGMHARANQGA